MEEQLILVDASDAQVGVADKLTVHRLGLKHRAFSVCVYTSHGDLIIQKRADGKYHSGGKWSNTCCGHPRDGEPIMVAAGRRLREEMGFTCVLEQVGTCSYELALEGGLIENEVDHVFLAAYDGLPTPDPNEVSQWDVACASKLEALIEGGAVTPWLPHVLRTVEATSAARRPPPVPAVSPVTPAANQPRWD